jgi:hypothetical protein
LEAPWREKINFHVIFLGNIMSDGGLALRSNAFLPGFFPLSSFRHIFEVSIFNKHKWILNTVLAVPETSHFLLFLRVMASVIGFLRHVFLAGIGIKNILNGLKTPVRGGR